MIILKYSNPKGSKFLVLYSPNLLNSDYLPIGREATRLSAATAVVVVLIVEIRRLLVLVCLPCKQGGR
jgi:hypothetical protein